MKQNQQRQYKNTISHTKLFIFIIVILLFCVAFFGPHTRKEIYQSGDVALGNNNEYEAGSLGADEVEEVEEQQRDIPKYVQIPDQVKAIYMSACVAGTPSFRNDLVELVETTELNSIMIDIKDFSGGISFPTDNPALLPAWNHADCGARDMKEFIAELHEKGIYVIGRITVFQDPFYTSVRPDLAVQKASDRSTWTDYKGLSFIDAGARDFWDYIIELSEESYAIGFDELNYDYVRFPSDGNMSDIYFSQSQAKIDANPETGKAEVVESFFAYLDRNIRGEFALDKDVTKRPITSADLFGLVTTAQYGFDLNIGQVLERALPHFDYIAPMVYPSHYPDGYNGWSDPNLYPYDLIKFVMEGGVNKVETFIAASSTPSEVKARVSIDQLRPWIQDFDYGGNYGPAEVRGQIQGVYDAGLDSWMIWAPSNRYTKAALKTE